MDWLSEAAGALGMAASGGIFGFLGSMVGGVLKVWQEKQRREWELAKHKMKLATMDMEMKIASQRGSWEGMVASHQSEAKVESSDVSRWANNIRTLFRPLLTVLLWALAFTVFYMILTGVFSQFLTPDEVKELVRYMVFSTFFTAATAATWWFAERGLTPPDMKHR